MAVNFANNPWLAAGLMAISAGVVGLLEVRGLSSALALAPISVGFILAQPPSTQTPIPPALLVGLIALVAGLYATLLSMPIQKRIKRPKLKPVTRSRAATYAVVLAAMVAVAAWFVVTFHLGHGGGWLILTIIVLVQPFVQDSFKKTIQRVAGTTIGFVFATIVAEITKTPSVIYVVGIIAMEIAILAMLTGRPYWQYVTCLTTAIVLLEGANTSVLDTAVTRLVATITGAAAVLAVTAIAQPLAKRSALSRGQARY